MKQILAVGPMGRETERARKCIEFAVSCFDKRGSTCFDSRHLLMGLYHEGRGIAHNVLERLGTTAQTLQDSFATDDQPLSRNDFAIDPEVRLVLQNAFSSMRTFSHNYLGTEHLLIGATTDGTKSATMLVALGHDPKEVAETVAMILGHSRDE